MKLLILVLLLFSSREYFPVKVADMAAGKNFHTHVSVIGKVSYVGKESDGDTHIRLEDGGSFIVAECIPMLPCPLVPQVGETLQVWGISRKDGEHKWYEVHPVERMEVVK